MFKMQNFGVVGFRAEGCTVEGLGLAVLFVWNDDDYY